MFSTFSSAALKTELLTDPAALGYAAAGLTAGNHVAAAAVINDPAKGGLISLSTISADRLLTAIFPGEAGTLTATTLTALNALCSAQIIDIGNANIQGWLNILFPSVGMPTTNAALVALRSRQGSRAEFLWGPGVNITAQQIGEALNT